MPTAAVLYIADKQSIALSMDEGPPNSHLMGSFSYLAIKKHQGNGQVKPGVVHHSTFKKPWGGDRRAGAQRWNPPTPRTEAFCHPVHHTVLRNGSQGNTCNPGRALQCNS